MNQHTTWQLAHLADCALPDARDGQGFDYEVPAQEGSPGADFLRCVEGAALERISEADDLREMEDVPAEVADSCVPIYTYDLWRTFTDLCAWQEDVGEFGPVEDMERGARVALYLIGERLAAALIAEAGEGSEDEEGGRVNDPIYSATHAEIQLARDWHGGQGSMLYAVSSTGGLSRGTEVFRAGRTDDEWSADLLNKLARELRETRRDILAYPEPDEVEGDLEVIDAWAAKTAALEMEYATRLEDEEVDA